MSQNTQILPLPPLQHKIFVEIRKIAYARSFKKQGIDLPVHQLAIKFDCCVRTIHEVLAWMRKLGMFIQMRVGNRIHRIIDLQKTWEYIKNPILFLSKFSKICIQLCTQICTQFHREPSYGKREQEKEEIDIDDDPQKNGIEDAVSAKQTVLSASAENVTQKLTSESVLKSPVDASRSDNLCSVSHFSECMQVFKNYTPSEYHFYVERFDRSAWIQLSKLPNHLLILAAQDYSNTIRNNLKERKPILNPHKLLSRVVSNLGKDSQEESEKHAQNQKEQEIQPNLDEHTIQLEDLARKASRHLKKGWGIICENAKYFIFSPKGKEEIPNSDQGYKKAHNFYGECWKHGIAK